MKCCGARSIIGRERLYGYSSGDIPCENITWDQVDVLWEEWECTVFGEAIGVSTLTIDSFTENSVTLSFTSVADSTGYFIETSLYSDFHVRNILSVSNNDDIEITGLLGNTTYYFRVRARVGSAAGNFSNVVDQETANDIDPDAQAHYDRVSAISGAVVYLQRVNQRIKELKAKYGSSLIDAGVLFCGNAYWFGYKLDTNMNVAVIYDASGNELDVTAAAPSQPVLSDDGKYMTFDGINDMLTVTSSIISDHCTGSNYELTVRAAIRAADVENFNCFFLIGNSGTPTPFITGYCPTSTSIGFSTRDNAGSNQAATNVAADLSDIRVVRLELNSLKQFSMHVNKVFATSLNATTTNRDLDKIFMGGGTPVDPWNGIHSSLIIEKTVFSQPISDGIDDTLLDMQN